LVREVVPSSVADMTPDCAVKLVSRREPVVPKMVPEVRVTCPAVVVNVPRFSTAPLRRFTGEVASAFCVPTCNAPALTEMLPLVDKALESLTVPSLLEEPTLTGCPFTFQAPEKSRVPPLAACKARPTAAVPEAKVTGPLKNAVPVVPEDASVEDARVAV
jgi:hypothetical protein